MTKMNHEVKARWVAALRSGEYKQGRGALRRTNGEMCCLGVLCDILAPELWKEPGDTAVNSDCYRHGGVIDTPNQTVRAIAGFQRATYQPPNDDEPLSTPKVFINGARDFLWAHNDAGRTFSEIADAIEAQL